MRTANHVSTTPVPLPVSPRALVIPYVLTPAKLDGLLRNGEALASISERLSAMMGRNGGPLAGELADLAALTIDLFDVVEQDPDLEDGGDEEPSLGWLHDGRTASGNDFHDLDCEEETADRLHDAEPDEGLPPARPPRRGSQRGGGRGAELSRVRLAGGVLRNRPGCLTRGRAGPFASPCQRGADMALRTNFLT
jgi:hypothetical protein